MGVFCFFLLGSWCLFFSLEIVFLGKRKPFALFFYNSLLAYPLFYFSCAVALCALCLFLMVTWGGLQSVVEHVLTILI